MTVVAVEITTSSARAEGLDPETLRRIAGRTFAEVKAAVERHGGTIEMVSGDAITVVFGLPIVHEDDAVRGVRAAVGARDALLALAAEFAGETALHVDFRVGVSTGEVIAGGDGLSQPRATGMPLTLSARLVHAAGPGEIVIDEATHRLARHSIGAERVDDAWRLLALTDSDARFERRLMSPMIGRTRERRRLHDAFEQAASDSSCQLFTVLGVAGVGKSRLVHEFLGNLAGPARVARGRCLPYGDGITFWPVLEVIREAVGDEDGDSPAKAGRWPASQGPDAELIGQQVAEMIGLAEGSGGQRTALQRCRRSSRRSREARLSCSSSTTSTGASRPSSISSSTSPTGRARPRSCSSASGARSCSRCVRAGAGAS